MQHGNGDGYQYDNLPGVPLSLHEASRCGDVHTLRRLLNEDPFLLIDSQRLSSEDDKHGGPPLYLASISGHVLAVRLLLERNADVNALTRKKGLTALTGACARGHVEVASLLLNNGADPSIRDLYEETCLMDAAHGGRPEIIRLLLRDPRVSVNEANRWGHTALWWACYSHRVDATRVLLLEGGADPTVADITGVTPIEIARRRGSWGCVKLLQWYERERERAYTLSKVWQLNDDGEVVRQAPVKVKARTHEEAQRAQIQAAPVYVRGRVERGEALPRVEVTAMMMAMTAAATTTTTAWCYSTRIMGDCGMEEMMTSGSGRRKWKGEEEEGVVRRAVLEKTMRGIKEDAFKILVQMMTYEPTKA